MIFPAFTLNKMIAIANLNHAHSLTNKLLEISVLDDINKMNRWFGYYQKVGEDLGLWTLEDVINWVRREKEVSP
jgi:hypothetical protein